MAKHFELFLLITDEGPDPLLHSELPAHRPVLPPEDASAPILTTERVRPRIDPRYAFSPGIQPIPEAPPYLLWTSCSQGSEKGSTRVA